MSQATYDGENGTHSRPMWRPTNAPVASSRTDDIWFLDPQRGWAVNSNGQIVHTEDGFATWEQQFHDPQVYLRCVGFASGTCGWVGTLTEDRRPLQVAVTVPAGADRLTIGIWDRFGEYVRQLLDEPQPTQGPRTVDWDVTDDTGQQLDDGSFLLRVTVDGQSESQIVHVKR